MAHEVLPNGLFAEDTKAEVAFHRICLTGRQYEAERILADAFSEHLRSQLDAIWHLLETSVKLDQAVRLIQNASLKQLERHRQKAPRGADWLLLAVSPRIGGLLLAQRLAKRLSNQSPRLTVKRLIELEAYDFAVLHFRGPTNAP